MSERDQDRDEAPAPNEFEPGEEEFEEEPEEGLEDEGEFEESREEEGRREAAVPPRRRFGFGRGGQGADEVAHRVTGSVRETHERVHIDDRPSAIYALVAAGVLIGVLAFALAGNFVPQPAVPSLSPLVVPTGQATASPSAGASVSIAPSASASVVPSAPASTAPTASPS